MPFRQASWLQRTTAPGLAGAFNSGHVSPEANPKTWLACTPIFVGSDEIAQMDAIFANHAISFDQANLWFVQNPLGQAALLFPWSITGAPGVNPLRYMRPRVKFSRSFFLANNSIGPGFLALDISDNGGDWQQVQKLYEWPHLIGTGGSSQAQLTVQVIPIFLPGTGPNGADRDWILVRIQVSSPLATPVDDHAWWYSDNFGYSWVRDRTETGPFAGSLLTGLRRSPTPGRLLALTGSNPFFSTNNGQTWSFGGGALPPTIKINLETFAGNTAMLLQAGGLSSACTVGVSCDDGATWGSGGPAFGPANTNPFGLKLSPTEVLVWCRDSDTVPTGVNVFYSDGGGENLTFQYKETRLPALQQSVVLTGHYSNGAPLVVGSNGVVLVSTDRPLGTPGARTVCPLANAGVAKAGPPDLCGHPMMQNRC